MVDTDEVVDEGALLGEATLAKLSATRAPEEAAPHAEKTEEKPQENKSESGQAE